MPFASLGRPLAWFVALATPALSQVDLAGLPAEPEAQGDADPDWLLDPAPFRAEVSRDGDRVVLDNGLIRRTFATQPNGATLAFDQQTSGQSLLRGIKPEASITIDGQQIDVGGLVGQPNYAFLTEEWIARLKTKPDALQLRRVAVGVGLHVQRGAGTDDGADRCIHARGVAAAREYRDSRHGVRVMDGVRIGPCSIAARERANRAARHVRFEEVDLARGDWNNVPSAI